MFGSSAPSLAALALACTCASLLTTPAPLAAQSGSSVTTPVPPAGSHVRQASDDPLFNIGRIDWPAPSGTRSANGTPGAEYWQQRADYTIAATLDTAAQSVTGTVKIVYTNHSPDTLRYVWLQLDQNLYKSQSKGSRLFPADSRWGVRGFEGGYQLSDVRVGSKSASVHVDDTMMRVSLDSPLAPGKSVTLSMGFAFRVPEHGSDRMGRDGTLYQIAQWFPRMAVYDDVRGWNTDPYLGQGEFYLEYGDIDFSITAPAGYVIAATGTLQNADDVLTSVQRQRLAQAAKSTSVVPIITAAEAKATPTPGTKTWRFLAKNVRDVAWSGAPDFRWDATSYNGIICQAYYQFDKAGSGWEAAAEQTQFSIKLYSELVYPYPYPQASAVAGTVGGMEYPMFVMVRYASPKNDPNSIFRTIDHEWGHMWFPMIVGSNERRYAWQDEGLNMYLNTFAIERRYANSPAGLGVIQSYWANWRSVHERGLTVPLMTMPDHIEPAALGAIGYRKPGGLLLVLRNTIVGKETFDAALRSYTQAWAFKHPTPADFFRHIESYSGLDLSWYWRYFWYSDAVIDVGVDTVIHRQDRTENFAVVVLRNVAKTPFPVTMRVKYASGKTEDVTLPVDIWSLGDTFEAVVPEGGNPVVGVRLWPDPSIPDWNTGNNSWGDAPPGDSVAPMTL